MRETYHPQNWACLGLRNEGTRVQNSDKGDRTVGRGLTLEGADLVPFARGQEGGDEGVGKGEHPGLQFLPELPSLFPFFNLKVELGIPRAGSTHPCSGHAVGCPLGVSVPPSDSSTARPVPGFFELSLLPEKDLAVHLGVQLGAFGILLGHSWVLLRFHHEAVPFILGCSRLPSPGWWERLPHSAL